MNKFFLSIAIFAIVALSGCKSTRSLSGEGSAMTSKALNKKMDNAAFDYKFFSAKARVTFEDEKMKQSFTANIRMQKDEVIWMSLTGPFGIEGGRVLIEKNRIQIIDRLNRKYYDEPFSYIDKYIPINADLALIQNIILGNPLEKTLSKQKIEDPQNTSDLYRATGEFGPVQAVYMILPEIFKYRRVNLTEASSSRKGNLDFSDYKKVDGSEFAFERILNFNDDKRKVQVELDFTKAKKEDSMDFPFNVPDKMKKVDVLE